MSAYFHKLHRLGAKIGSRSIILAIKVSKMGSIYSLYSPFPHFDLVSLYWQDLYFNANENEKKKL